ncbi:MAG: hypothetical protein ACTTKS_02395 [Bulleidia sp.]
MKITREVLKNYKKMKLELQLLNKEREYIYDTYRSPAFNGEVSDGIKKTDSPVERAVAKLQKIDEKRGELIAEMMKVEDQVDMVEDQLIRPILQYRYIFGFSWKATASIMTMSEGYVRTCERRYFNKR